MFKIKNVLGWMSAAVCIFLAFFAFYRFSTPAVEKISADRLPIEFTELFESQWVGACFFSEYEIPSSNDTTEFGSLNSPVRECWSDIEVPSSTTYISGHYDDGSCVRYAIALPIFSDERSSSRCIGRATFGDSTLIFDGSAMQIVDLTN